MQNILVHSPCWRCKQRHCHLLKAFQVSACALLLADQAEQIQGWKSSCRLRSRCQIRNDLSNTARPALAGMKWLVRLSLSKWG